jgi:hypothetical protein
MKDNDLIYRQHGEGWEALVAPLIAKANELDATVDQVKEKFGGLRFYYTPAYDTDDTELADMVDAAEAASKRTCELCGAPGVTMTKGYWLKTLCKNDAIQLGYKDKA